MTANTKNGLSSILGIVLIGYFLYNYHDSKISDQEKEMNSYKTNVERSVLDAIVDMCDTEFASDLKPTINELSNLIDSIRPEYWETKETICSKAFKKSKRKPTPPKPAKQWSEGLALGVMPFPSDYSLYVGENCIRKKEYALCHRSSGYSDSVIQDLIFNDEQNKVYIITYQGNEIESFLPLSKCNVVEKSPHSHYGEIFCLTDSLIQREEDAYFNCNKDSLLIVHSKQNGGDSEKKLSEEKNYCTEEVKKLIGYVPKEPRRRTNLLDKDLKSIDRLKKYFR
jgi:hypothetical protein